MNLSTGFKNALMVATKACFDGGVIEVWSGTPPASADLAPTGVRLGAITRNGVPDADPSAGLIFEAAGQFLVKPTTTLWRLRVDHSGTAGWWRLVEPGDNPAATGFDSIRIDGVVGTGDPYPADTTLWIPTLSLVAGFQYPIDSFFFAVPPFPES